MRIRTRRLTIGLNNQFTVQFWACPKFAGFLKMAFFLAKSEHQIFLCAKLNQIGEKWGSSTTDIDRYPKPHDDAILTSQCNVIKLKLSIVLDRFCPRA